MEILQIALSGVGGTIIGTIIGVYGMKALLDRNRW